MSLRKYINGNYFVTSGTMSGNRIRRALRIGEEFCPAFPDSIDLKITNSCSHGCPFCHENSVRGGKSFDYQKTIAKLSGLPNVPIEIAIGGGNILDCFDSTVLLIEKLKDMGFIPAITLKDKDLKDDSDRAKKLIELVGWNRTGVSIESFYSELVSWDSDIFGDFRDRPVFHVIAGLFPLEDFKKLLDGCIFRSTGILVLGYKQFGRAKGTSLPESLDEWSKYLRSMEPYGTATLGFDNLAIEQLGLESFLKDMGLWDRVYCGDEFSTSMYIDAVEGTYAPTSRSSERMDWDTMSIVSYFNTYKNDYTRSTKE